jgi:hypothetical protein
MTRLDATAGAGCCRARQSEVQVTDDDKVTIWVHVHHARRDGLSAGHSMDGPFSTVPTAEAYATAVIAKARVSSAKVVVEPIAMTVKRLTDTTTVASEREATIHSAKALAVILDERRRGAPGVAVGSARRQMIDSILHTPVGDGVKVLHFVREVNTYEDNQNIILVLVKDLACNVDTIARSLVSAGHPASVIDYGRAIKVVV